MLPANASVRSAIWFDSSLTLLAGWRFHSLFLRICVRSRPSPTTSTFTASTPPSAMSTSTSTSPSTLALPRVPIAMVVESITCCGLSSFDFKLFLFFFCRQMPGYFVFVDRCDSSLDEFNVFFRKRFVESNEATVISSRILDVWCFTVKPLFDWILFWVYPLAPRDRTCDDDQN